MALTAPIYSDFDERSAAEAMARAERVVSDGARDISRVFSDQMSDGIREGSRALDRFADDAQSAYRRAGEAAEELERRERALQELRDRGASNTELRVQSERVAEARRDEARATREAAAAIDEYEDRARGSGSSFIDSLRGSISDAGSTGGDMANELVGGFAASSALLRLGAATGPIGLALTAAAALGVTAGKLLGDNIAAGLASMQMEDLFQARLGVDDATMARYGESAANAYTSMFGASVEDNLRAVQFGVQGGFIAPDAQDAEIDAAIAHLQTLAQVMEVDVQEAARAAGQLIRGGFAADGEQAADIIATGFQNGLDISGDWLDTITEYSTQFRKLGLDGQDAIGLISQGLQGAARDSDVVADSIKEFSIRAVDGSELTAQGFSAIGFQADDMAQRFLAGGDSARSAFDATLRAIRSLEDPIQQAMTWQALFGTQWEDMGDAINSMDLSSARSEFSDTGGAIDTATGQLGEHVNQWDVLGRNIDVTFGKLQKWLADSAIGRFFSQGIPNVLNSAFGPDAEPKVYPDVTTPQDVNDLWYPGGMIAPAPSAPTGSSDPDSTGGQRPPMGPDNPLSEFLAGGPPAGTAPGVPGAPVPGERTPILTDTQQKAADEAAKAAGGGGEALPSAPSLPLQYTATAGLPAQVANAVARLDEARHAVAEKEARVNQLMQSNVADADDIQKARNDLTKAEQDQMQAEQSLHDARVKATEQQTKQISGMSSELSDMGAKLDADLGASKGLGGIVENFIKAAGNILAAPFLQALGLIEQANPNEGSGLVGILAANGAFGSQFTPGVIGARGASGVTGGYSGGYSGGMVGPGGSGGAPSEAQVKAIAASFGLSVTSEDRPGDPGYHGRGMALDISNGSGNTPEMQAFAQYMSQNFGGSLKELIYDAPGWAGNIKDGKNTGAFGNVYTMDQAGDHTDHVHIAAQWGSTATQASGALTNLAGAAQQATGALTGAGGQWNADWNAIAQAESGGNWQINTGNGYYGGLQFSPSSWQAAGGTQYAPSAEQATPYQQALTAEQLLALQGPGAWPNTFVPGSSGPPAPVGGGGAGMSGLFPGMAGPPRSALAGLAGAPGLPGAGTSVTSGMPSQGMGATGGGGMQGMGGMAMDAAMASTAALDMMAPGAGAAAKIGIQLANRGIAQAGKVGGIAASGVLETIGLSKSALANPANNWIGKFATGVSGAGMAIPNTAGKMSSPQMQPGQGGQQGQAGHVGDIDKSTHIQVDASNRDNGQGIANDIATQQMAMNTSPGH